MKATMNLEQPQFNNPQLEKGKGTLKQKLQKAVALGGIAAATFAGEGCAQEKDSGVNTQQGNKLTNEDIENDPDVRNLDRAFEQSGKPIEALLRSYYDNVAKGRAPAGAALETKARAWEIARKKGFRVTDLGDIEVVNAFHVPVQIKVNGQIVPVGPDDYTKRELELVRTSEQISKEMSGISKNPVRERTEKSNTSEVRKSKSDF
jgi:hypothetical protein